MRVTFEVGGYNSRRYGRPWIARVTAWPIGKQPTLEFGGNVGPHLAEIDAEPGQVVRFGQRDHRGRHSQADWGIVQADGSIREHDPEFCRRHWLAGCPVPLHEDETNVVKFREGNTP